MVGVDAVDLALAGTDVKVHVVNPAMIDTDLFHLPDNDETHRRHQHGAAGRGDGRAGRRAARRSGAFEIYVPGWFRDIVAGKLENPDGFLEGSIAYLRERTAAG